VRLWSIRPRCLDPKHHKDHPQLERFRARRDPLRAIDAYLTAVERA
jgi:hypothetical protein